MKAADIIVILAMLIIVGAALAYIIISKKRGKKCIGCPYSSSCTRCSCTDKNENK